MGISIDVSEVLALGADLDAAGAKVADGMRPIVSKGALAIKTQMAAEMGGSPSFAEAGRRAPTAGRRVAARRWPTLRAP